MQGARKRYIIWLTGEKGINVDAPESRPRILIVRHHAFAQVDRESEVLHVLEDGLLTQRTDREK